MCGWITRMIGRVEYGREFRVILEGPDRPIGVFRVKAGHLRIVTSDVHQGIHLGGSWGGVTPASLQYQTTGGVTPIDVVVTRTRATLPVQDLAIADRRAFEAA